MIKDDQYKIQEDPVQDNMTETFDRFHKKNQIPSSNKTNLMNHTKIIYQNNQNTEIPFP